MSKWERPQELSNLDVGFGPKGGISKVLPKWEEIPEEFKVETGHINKWIKILDHWFFGGIKITNIVMRNGIEKDLAIRHIGCIMHSFEPKHEHKIAGCAYLLSLWFEKFEYIKNGVEKEGES